MKKTLEDVKPECHRMKAGRMSDLMKDGEGRDEENPTGIRRIRPPSACHN